MRLMAIAVVVLLAGCSEGPPGPAATDEARRTGTPSASSLAGPVVELAGSNVTWIGTGSVDWDVIVPDGLQSMAFHWYDTGLVGPGIMLGTLSMPGCEDKETRSFGGAAGSTWCHDPPVGANRATYTLQAGQLRGRLCIVAIPQGNTSVGECLGSPY